MNKYLLPITFVLSWSALSSLIVPEFNNNLLPTEAALDTLNIQVPLGGNSWVSFHGGNGRERVDRDGWKNWEDKNAVFSAYVGISKPGILRLSAFITGTGISMIQCTINGVSKNISINGMDKKKVLFGEWSVKAGYLKIDIKGITRTGTVFAFIDNLLMSGSAIDTQLVYVKNNDDNYFYWGRRGPSVHINYDLHEAGDSVEWFYNEVTVPKDSDPVGSYFMANGFAEGYFGIQVNSDNERRVLFSVWSPYTTDNPAEVPENKKIKLLRKGAAVHAGEFGDEGSGGQSYLRYNWKAGTTYSFLIRAQPMNDNYTDYTAWFYAPESDTWQLIASFSRPFTQNYFSKLHSFLENFEPLNGDVSRKAFYNNQWAIDKNGTWIELNKMTFTGDLTAKKAYRRDYAGGEEKGAFFLKNGGFFNDSVALKTQFVREKHGGHPKLDLSKLP